VDRRTGLIVGGKDEGPAIRINSVSYAPLGMVQGSRRRVAPCMLTGVPSKLEKWRWAAMTFMFTGNRDWPFDLQWHPSGRSRAQYGMKHELVAR